MASLADAEEALRSTNAKANFQRLTRLLMCGGLRLLRETFDSIHSPADLPLKLGDPTIQAQLKGARLSRPEWNCLYPSPGVYGKSTDCDITLLFRLLRTICNLTPPPGPRGWDNLPNSSDVSLEADLVRIKYYRNEVHGHKKTMEISDVEFVRLWNEISEALLRIAATISHAKRDEWKTSIGKYLSDPLTPEEKRCYEELKRWYMNDMDVKAEVQGLREDAKAWVEKLDVTVKEEVKTLKEDMKRDHESIQEEVRRLREEVRQSRLALMYITGPVQVTEIASSHTSEAVGQMAKPEYRNWLALGHALTTVLCQGLRPFINREMETFYKNATAKIGGPCTCFCVPRRKPSKYHDMSTCAWANTLQAYHHRRKPNWKQSDCTKWIDPILGPWEIAKLFLPDLGARHAGIKSADDMDITDILNLMYWCNHFTIPQPLINDIRQTRNNKWVHVPKLELSNADKTEAFDAIGNLLKDPQLASDADAQKALREIVNIKSVTDLHSMEAQILAEFKEVINKEILNLTQESERNKEQVKLKLKQQHVALEKAVEDLGERNKPLPHLYLVWVCELLVYLFGSLVRSLKGFRRAILLLFLFWSFCGNLDDDTVIKDGCAIKRYDDRWKLKYFDFSDFVTSSRTDFIGRQWLYREMEKIMDHTSTRGVLLIGNPGSGKTAFVSNLLCSRTSSPFIHNRILGYHFCMHSDKGTQNAAKFVGNLASMVASTFAQYSEIISSDSFVHRVLHNICPQDPEWCFQEGILRPLKNLPNQPKEPWYIIIDALDECSTDGGKADILNMLKSTVPRLPKWLKLIITSRNISAITKGLDGMQTLELRSDDQRNLKDIDI